MLPLIEILRPTQRTKILKKAPQKNTHKKKHQNNTKSTPEQPINNQQKHQKYHTSKRTAVQDTQQNPPRLSTAPQTDFSSSAGEVYEFEVEDFSRRVGGPLWDDGKSKRRQRLESDG